MRSADLPGPARLAWLQTLAHGSVFEAVGQPSHPRAPKYGKMRVSCGEDSLTTVYRFTALLLLIAGSLMSQGPINTIPSWDGSTFVAHFGAPNTATYGQTIIIAPGSAVVSSFGFEMGVCDATVTFRGEIYAWDGAKATGPSLFESPVATLDSSDSFQLVTFNTGALTLPPGAYVIFATTSRDQVTASQCEWGSLQSGTAAYPAGRHVFMNNGAIPSQWTTVAWGTEPFDLAFEVNMEPAPPPPTPTGVSGVPAASPATLLLGFAGVIALGLLGLSRLRMAR
jgi:hypothetical protein